LNHRKRIVTGSLGIADMVERGQGPTDFAFLAVDVLDGALTLSKDCGDSPMFVHNERAECGEMARFLNSKAPELPSRGARRVGAFFVRVTNDRLRLTRAHPNPQATKLSGELVPAQTRRLPAKRRGRPAQQNHRNDDNERDCSMAKTTTEA
jgi:hypothetical protein